MKELRGPQGMQGVLAKLSSTSISSLVKSRSYYEMEATATGTVGVETYSHPPDESSSHRLRRLTLPLQPPGRRDQEPHVVDISKTEVGESCQRPFRHPIYQ